ncbi:MAG: carboxypeptidase-like regulatory domain-containing protein [Tannerella sp.]|nr:carboxypeptidase-like regulatory domain-containing protein [Tannerella sp.]
MAKNAAVREILRQIEDKTDFLFLYNQEEVDVNRKTSMNVRKKNVPEILSELFNATDVRYIVEGTNIVLVKLPPAARPTIAGRQTGRRITGTVVDATGEPVVGANVVEKGVPANGTVTDVDGNFSLTVADNAVLQISFMGYITQEISVLSAGGGGSLQSSC